MFNDQCTMFKGEGSDQALNAEGFLKMKCLNLRFNGAREIEPYKTYKTCKGDKGYKKEHRYEQAASGKEETANEKW